MGIRIRQIELRAMTDKGQFGVSIPLEDGLTIVWAPNTSGKSTCAMAVLYGLGLEGMLGPSHLPPFPAAMMDKLIWDEQQYEVLSSYVRLEIQNDSGDVVTIHRAILGSSQDRQLIRVQMGPAISAEGDYPRRDFYVRTAGAATMELGFHTFLAKFAGLELPIIDGADGSHVPLYLECLCPYFIVEQISGWRDVKARMPTYLRIPEMAKRAFEFILRFDVLAREMERQALLQTESRLKHQWSMELDAVKQRFQGTGALIKGIGPNPEVFWPPTPVPQLLLTNGADWFSHASFVDQATAKLEQIRNEELPTVAQVSDEILEALRTTEAELVNAQAALADLNVEVEAEQAQVIAIDQRLDNLREDMRKYQSAKKLEDRGGFSGLSIAKGMCPTCHQAIKDALLSQDRPINPMSLDDNIIFLRDQIETFRDMREESRSALEARRKQSVTARNRVRDLSNLVRDHKRMLRSDADAPSAAAIRKELQLEQLLDGAQRSAEVFHDSLLRFAALSSEWVKNQSRLKAIASSGLSEQDGAKLDLMREFFLQQLKEYGFSSYKLDELSISRESYRPVVNGVEFGLTSASDGIRCIWAYLLSVLEVASSFATNHAGFVIFDEPKQQSAADLSFAALLRRAATAKGRGQQVLFFTSEKRERLVEMIGGLDCKCIMFDGKMLVPVGTAWGNDWKAQ